MNDKSLSELQMEKESVNEVIQSSLPFTTNEEDLKLIQGSNPIPSIPA